MKIALIELDFHFDCVDGFCKTFEFTGHELTIYIKPRIFEKIRHQSYVKKYAWVFCEKTSRTRFLKRNLHQINQADFIFIDTIASEFGAYVKAGFRSVTIARTHNAFKLFDPWRHIRIYPSPYYWWKAFSYFIREIVINGFWYYRPRLLRKIDYFVFPDEGITRFVREQGWLAPEKILPPFPMKTFESEATEISLPGEVFQVTIIGSVDQRRRDYEPVVRAFRQLVPSLKRPLALTLLGKASGSFAMRVVSEFREMTSGLFRFEYFTEMVDQDLFDRRMAATQVIISPITLNVSTEIFGEIYGKTKITGSLLDLLRFPRITLLPASYAPGDDFAPLLQQYRDAADIANLLQHYLEDEPDYVRQSERILQTIAGKYNRTAIADQIVRTVTGLKKQQE